VKKWQLDQHIAKTPIDHPDLSVTRAKLEYPTVNVSLVYLDAIGKTAIRFTVDYRILLSTLDSFSDKAIEAMAGDAHFYLVGRYVDSRNFYFDRINTAATTADHEISKMSAGTVTLLAYEAVDLYQGHWLKFSISGTTLSSYRDFSGYAQITVTDSAFSSGSFGTTINVQNTSSTQEFPALPAYLRAPSSPAPQPLGYFEVPIIGDGSADNPFRVQVPELIVEDANLGKRNLLALSHSALIPTDKSGKPIHGTAIMRVFAQPDRDPSLKPISDCIVALKAMRGVTKLTREMAIKRAKQMDDKLSDSDLLMITKPTKQQIREYADWRKNIHNVEMSEAEIIQYLANDKGW
jgi:hypothetical protein